jgi:hypothetical protein
VFGLSDIAGHFFPIAFGIISREQEIDFITFFQTLLALCKELNIQPVIKYLMQDACGASANGAEAIFGPNIVILMCYFHVQKNVKEYLKSIEELYQFQYDQFVSQRATDFAINKFIVDYNNSIFINNQQQQQFYPIFSNSPSILLAKPQTIKKGVRLIEQKKFKRFKFGIILYYINVTFSFHKSCK